MHDFEIMKEILPMGVLHNGCITCITTRNICCCDVCIIHVHINVLILVQILVRLYVHEQIMQVIFYMISACQLNGYL